MKCSINIIPTPLMVLFMIYGWTNAAGGDNDHSCDEDNPCDPQKYLVCGTTGICSCPSGSIYQLSRRRCEVQRQQNCTFNPNCDVDLFLTCRPNHNNIRQCDCGDDWVWNGAYCNGLVGAPCSEVTPIPFLDSCITNAECNANKICVCKDKYAQNEDKRCGETTYGSPCNEKRQCDVHHFLDCKGNRCICENPGGMIWDNKDECVALVDEECDRNRGNDDRQLDCVAGAKCVGTGNKGTCQCTGDNNNVTDIGGCTDSAHTVKYTNQNLMLIIAVGFVAIIFSAAF